MPPVLKPLWSCCAFLLCVCLFSGCGQQAEPHQQAEPPVLPQRQRSAEQTAWPTDNRRSDIYVGSKKCAECHREIYDTYFSQHPMGSSIDPLEFGNGETVVPTTATVKSGTREYHVFLKPNGRLAHAESMSDSEGEIYRHSVEVDFAVGSGTRGYSYVIENNGCLYQSSLTWYSHGERWDLSPGYQSDSHPGFSRRITEDCIFCHSGQSNRVTRSRDRFNKPIFMEASIGCEKCHGPGDAHCQQHLSGQVGSADSIVNPAKLSPTRRDSVCYQCHLHGEDRILRRGRSSFDFRPGDLLSDVWVVLTQDRSESEKSSHFEAVSQAEQMVTSACYKKSDGSLGCISCHSPHSTPTKSQRVDFYRGKCTECHGGEQSECSQPRRERLLESPNDSCIRCHMPKAPASDVPHTAQTDHRVLRSYSPSESSRGPTRLRPFEAADFPVTRADLRRALGLQLEQNASTKSDAEKALELLSDVVELGIDIESLLAASWLHLRLGNLSTARTLAARAVQLNPDSESALEAMAIALQQEQKPAEALEYLNLVLKKAPFSAVLQTQKAELLTQLGRHELAVEALKTALSISPSQPQLRGHLIDALQSAGRSNEVAAQQAILRRMIERSNLTKAEQ